jgi:hypothetical protein
MQQTETEKLKVLCRTQTQMANKESPAVIVKKCELKYNYSMKAKRLLLSPVCWLLVWESQSHSSAVRYIDWGVTKNASSFFIKSSCCSLSSSSADDNASGGRRGI